MERTRKLISRKPYSYAALGHDGESLVIAGEDEFIFTFDSLTPVVVPDKKEMENKGMYTEQKYFKIALVLQDE